MPAVLCELLAVVVYKQLKVCARGLVRAGEHDGAWRAVVISESASKGPLEPLCHRRGHLHHRGGLLAPPRRARAPSAASAERQWPNRRTELTLLTAVPQGGRRRGVVRGCIGDERAAAVHISRGGGRFHPPDDEARPQ